MKYLVILLDDTSVSYCHYANMRNVPHLISIDNLKAGIIYAMKENLVVQFVYPEYELPLSYTQLIETVAHSKIVPESYRKNADVVVLSDWTRVTCYTFRPNTAYVIRTSKDDFFRNYLLIENMLYKTDRLNIVITDIDIFSETDFKQYKQVLSKLSNFVSYVFKQGKRPQLNLLTDRIMLRKMNNCNAGVENLTLAPDGNFYICPAFYQDGKESVGNLCKGVFNRNSQLYKIDYAPLCRQCDAYQCRRCIYLNQKTTLEVNTPSHEQCVVAHLERNASQILLENKHVRDCFPKQEIKKISYLDPFEIKDKW